MAVAVMAVWGSNFVIIKFALAHLPPLFFAALRFTLAFFPAVLFVKRPQVPWTHLAAYGVLIGAGQFGVLYIAMEHDISPGLASLVIQTQVFFTIGLAMLATKERVAAYQWLALVLAAGGLAIIVMRRGGDVTVLGLGLTLLAAFSWASGNIVARASSGVNMLAYVIWSSAFAVPPLLLLSLAFDGWPAIVAGFTHADTATWAAVAYQSFGNTLFGYGAWAWLMARHPAATVSPFALLVPVFGMGTAALALGEPLQPWKIEAAALVMSGLAINLVWPRLRRRAMA
jgi:O-acetylserine/cysteine efflux transporter